MAYKTKKTQNKFEPVMYRNTKKDKNSMKDSYNDIEVYDLDSLVNKDGEFDIVNGTTLDYRFETEPSDSFKKRVKAQVEGYSSELEKQNKKGENKNAHSNGEKFYNERKKASKEKAAKKKEITKAGLTASKRKDSDFDEKTMFDEGKIKRLTLNNTVFLSENQVRKSIPEKYKNYEGRFIMRDGTGKEYMVENKHNKYFGVTETFIEKLTNKEEINETLEHIHHLFDYNRGSYKTKSDSSDMGDLLNIMRVLKK